MAVGHVTNQQPTVGQMTAEQMERLPVMLREIVALDREHAEMRRCSVVDFAFARAMREHRRRLQTAAESRWGYRAGNSTGGPQTA